MSHICDLIWHQITRHAVGVGSLGWTLSEHCDKIAQSGSSRARRTEHHVVISSPLPSPPLPSILLPSRVSLVLLIVAFGCGAGGGQCTDPFGYPEDNSLYIYCKGHSELYWENNKGEQKYELGFCIESSLLNETGAGGTDGEIDLAGWTNDADDLEFMRTLCVEKCKEWTTAEDDTGCEQKLFPESPEVLWEVENYLEQPTPDPLMDILQPWHRTCADPEALLAPRDTTVVPTGAPVWPGTANAVSVTCGDFGTCDALFIAPIGHGLYYDDNAVLWGADMGYADYLATTSSSSSQLEITILNPGGTPSSDAHEVEGRIEFSAPDCGETECPFYLANLTLTNTEDTWALHSEDYSSGDGDGDGDGDPEGADVYISDITVQLRRPTLGVWNTSTNQVYLGAERVDIYVSLTHQIEGESPVDGGYLITNADGIFGEIDGGEIEILNLAAGDGGNVEFEADLVYDTVAGEPPTANSGLGSTITAPTGAGFPISYLTDTSSDPDNDIDEKIWFVDGVARTSAYTIPIGAHKISLRVIDDRGATDQDDRLVTVLSP